MAVPKNPQLEERWAVFPQGRGEDVIDFWSGVYELGADESNEKYNLFSKGVMDYLDNLDYDTYYTNLVFRRGLFGPYRTGLLAETRRSEAEFFFKMIGDSCYVSLRLYYCATMSWLKLFAVFLCAAVISGFIFVTDSGSPTSSDRIMLGLVVLTIIIFGGLIVVGGIYSFIKTGRFDTFVLEDFNELYRDDVASLGHFAYAAIVTSADRLSLKATLDNNANPPPAFGVAAQTRNTVKRRPRI